MAALPYAGNTMEKETPASARSAQTNLGSQDLGQASTACEQDLPLPHADHGGKCAAGSSTWVAISPLMLHSMLLHQLL